MINSSLIPKFWTFWFYIQFYFFFFCKIIFMSYWWTIKNYIFISKRGLNSEILHIWKAYFTLEIVKQDKCPKYNGSSIFACSTHYCVWSLLCQAKYSVHTFIWYALVQLSPVDILLSYHASLCVSHSFLIQQCSCGICSDNKHLFETFVLILRKNYQQSNEKFNQFDIYYYMYH